MKRALIIAPAALLGASAFGAYSNVDLSSYADSDLQGYTDGSNYPTAGNTVSVGNVSFTLSSLQGNSGTTGVIGGLADAAATVDITIGQYGVTSLYTLINTAWGYPGTTVGEIVAHGAGGESYEYDLVEGLNVRDHYDNPRPYCNSLTDLSVQSAYFPDSNDLSDPHALRLDMQTIELPTVFKTDTLTDVEFINLGKGSDGSPFLAGLATSTAVPEPVSAIAGLSLAALALAKRRQRR
jgi:hypothetical protein